jgi:acetyl esterase/lipase
MEELLTPARGAAVVADLQTRFDRLDVPYKTVNGTPIEAAILVPRTLASATEAQSAPVLAHFHGGGLVLGTNPEPFFLADWVRDLAHSTPAIFISAAYRLIPEAKATDSLDDVADFWVWVHRHLLLAIRSRWPHLTPDLDRIAAIGESAGGYLALQSAFLYGATAQPRAVVASYPAIYPDIAAYNPRPQVPDPKLDAVVEDYLASIPPGTVQTSAPFPQKGQLSMATTRNGSKRRILGEDPEGRLTLAYALERVREAGTLPPIWIIQGSDDTVVAPAATDAVVEGLRKALPDVVVKYTVRPGEHGFDVVSQLDDDWVADGVEFVKGFWV